MNKIILSLVVASFIISCGSNNDKNESKETGNDLSRNPDYQEGLALVSKQGNLCLTCHKIDEKLTGPPYRDVANKYENTEANVKMLAERIMKGSTGVWGEIMMPPNSLVTKDEAESMVKYILLLKK